MLYNDCSIKKGDFMKLKFRAEPKDIVIFIIFCFLLLYVVAFVELNIIEFSQNAEFHGLNPLPAFSPELFAPTMVFWLGSLIAIIISASNYFWDNESGFGFKFGKKEKKGYSRFATEKEFKKQLVKVDPKLDKLDAAGIPLINTDKEVWVDNGESHSLIIGSTGSGKTQGVVQPMVSILAKAGESMIITDPKGEIYRDNGTLLEKNGYNIIVLNLRDPELGNAWNPLAMPYQYFKAGKFDKASELLEDLGANITHEENNDDPFWNNASSDFFAGLAQGLFVDAKEEEININSIYSMATSADETLPGTRQPVLNAYYDFKDKNDVSFINVNTTINAAGPTKSSVLSVFRQKVKAFANRKNLSEMLSYSDFDMEDIGRKKTAVFIIVQDEKKTYHALATIFIKQVYETLISVAQTFPNGKLPNRTNFILDEFANMPPIKDIDSMISASRSRNIRLNFIIQNFAQLDTVYGESVASTIKGNSGNIVYLISTELKGLEEISKLAGEKESKKDDKTASTPLLSVSDLQRLKMYDFVILRQRMMPYITKVTPFWQTNKQGKWGKHLPIKELEERESREVQLFDIKEFIKKKQEENGTLPQGGISGAPSSLEELMAMRAGNHVNANTPNAADIVRKKLEELKQQEEMKKEQEARAKRAEEKINAILEEKRRKKAEESIKKEEVKEEKKKTPTPKEISDTLGNLASETNDETPAKPLPKASIINDDKPTPKKVESKIVEETPEDNTDFVTDDEFFDDFFADEDDM
jgi:type IV secretion system protein VirD4